MAPLPKHIKHFLRDINQWSFHTMAIGFFMAIPLLAIVVYLFDGVGEMWSHISRHYLMSYCTNSLFLLLGTGTLCFLFGTSTAWIVSTYEFPFRKAISWLLFLPLAIPSYIVAYAYVGMLGNGGTLIGWMQGIGLPMERIDMMNIFGLIWVLSCSLYPYVYAGTRAMFSTLPRSLQEASALLGAGQRRYLFSVALPLVLPAIIGGLMLVFMEVLNDYGAAKYYGINTFTTGIFRSWTLLEDLQSAVYLSALLVIAVLLLNALARWQRGRKSYAAPNGALKPQSNRRKQLSGPQKLGCLLVVSIPLIFGFLLPVGQLLYWAVLTFDTMFNAELLTVTLQSFGVALGAGLLVVVVALGLIFFSRWNLLKPIRAFQRIAVVGYVIPGAIIGIGIIRSSQSIIQFFSDTLQLNIGFLFYSSSAVLIYAYVFRFLAVSYNPISANSLKLGKNLGESSYLLGIGKFKTMFQVELPLLRNTLIGAFLLVFIDVLKELPLTLILKPYKLNTLAVKAYEYADDERVPEAALPALTLIAVIVLLMAMVSLIDQKLEKKRT